MAVGFGVSVVVRGETVDPAKMLSEVAAIPDAQAIEVLRVGDVVRFTASQVSDLSVLAEPIAEWWLRHRPTTAGGVTLRFVGPNGINELGYCVPEMVIEQVRHTIEAESGRVYEPGEAPGRLRRLAAGLLRRTRTGFTATEIAIREENGVLCVAVAGRELDDEPRSIEFQAFNPHHLDYDPDDDDGYCLVNEDHILVYGSLVSLRVNGPALRIKFTDEAARLWGMRSEVMTVRLHLSSAEIEQLRSGLRRVFAFAAVGRPVPDIDLRQRGNKADVASATTSITW